MHIDYVAFIKMRLQFDSSTPILTESSLIPNADLKPEITGSYEFGLDLRFSAKQNQFRSYVL